MFSKVKENLIKLDERYNQQDFKGTITISRTLVEETMKAIYKELHDGQQLDTGDLIKAYKNFKSLLNLKENEQNGHFKKVYNGITSIIVGIASIRNDMGDSHSIRLEPNQHQTSLVKDLAKSLSTFLMETYNYQKSQKQDLLDGLIKILNSPTDTQHYSYKTYKNSRYSLNLEELLKEKPIKEILPKCNNFMKRLIINELIKTYQINSFATSGIFWSIIYLFNDQLTDTDMKIIYEKNKNNNQTNVEDCLTNLCQLNNRLNFKQFESLDNIICE